MTRPLDFSPLDQRQQILQSSAYRAELKSQHPVFEAALKGLGDITEAQKQLRTGLNSLTEFDEDITLDAQVNSWLADDFQKNVKDTYVTNLLGKEKKVGQKWFLTNSDLNQIQAKAKQWDRTASNAKNLVNARANATQEVQKNHLIYEIDNEERQKFEDVITGKKDVPNPNAIFQDIMQNPDGAPPFLRIKEHDLEQGIGESVIRNISKLGKYMQKPGTEIETIENGKNVIRKTTEWQLSPQGKEAMKTLVLSDIVKDPKLPGYGKWLGKQDGALGGPVGVEDYVNNYDFEQHFDFGEEKTTKISPVTEKVKGKGLRLNFSGGDSLDYDSNRKDFTVEGREYKDAFTFPEYATKERIDVVSNASQVSGARKEAPKDITEVGRLVLYDMDRDIIVVQDKDGFYYEAPRKDNETVLRGLIHPEDYNYIREHQSGRKPTTKEPEPMIKKEDWPKVKDEVIKEANSIEEAQASIEALFKEDKITKRQKESAISGLDVRANRKYWRKKVKEEPVKETEVEKTEVVDPLGIL